MQLEELEREDEQLSNEIQGLRKVDAMINKELGETESKLQGTWPLRTHTIVYVLLTNE